MNQHGYQYFVVVNGFGAVILKNSGTATHPDLQRVWSMEDVLSHTIRPRYDRPGRMYQSANQRRSAYESKNRLTSARKHFLEGVLNKVEHFVHEGDCASVVLVAAPTALGILRATMPKSIADRVTFEASKDYTKSSRKGLQAKLLNYVP